MKLLVTITPMVLLIAACRETAPSPHAGRRTTDAPVDASVPVPITSPPPTPRHYCPSAELLATEPASAFVGAIERDLATRTFASDAPASDAPASLARVIAADHAIRSDGLMGYLRGPLGSTVRDAIAAMRRVRADESATVLERSIGIFGPRGPSRDDAERSRQIAALGDAAPRVWSALDGIYLRYGEDLARGMQRWVREEAARVCRDAG